jgi:hypothetical protein
MMRRARIRVADKKVDVKQQSFLESASKIKKKKNEA